MNTTRTELSVVVPVYNEQDGIQTFHTSLQAVLEDVKLAYEVLYVNDGSRDDTLAHLRDIAAHNERVRFLSFSRNFGKELAVTAGIHEAAGKAILTLDADGQHPVQKIPEFIAKWQAGAQVVTGVRTANRHRGALKGIGSSIFYGVINKFSGLGFVAGSTDFRLIDQVVRQDFVRLTERNRITRGLIDWLGYPQQYIEFEADERIAGEATYSYTKLLKLFIDGVVSMSVSPLYVVAYIGGVVLPASLLLGLVMAINGLTGDHLNINATGSAYVGVLTLALVGILMVSQGVIGLYLSHIHAESQNRPLYIIDETKSSMKA
jgi:dolichol-phosphate mannosyltransferase